MFVRLLRNGDSDAKMRICFIVLLVVLLVGCMSKVLKREDYDPRVWPFRVDAVKLACQDDAYKAVWTSRLALSDERE